MDWDVLMSFFEMLYQMLSYTFMQRALIVGVLIALCSALLGVSLVLKRYSMIGDGLSHVGFGTLAVASALNLAAPLELAIPVVIAAAFFLLKLSYIIKQRNGYRYCGYIRFNRA